MNDSYANRPGIQAAPTNHPKHIAIVMDGNGRWALAQHLPRSKGHRKGGDTVRSIIASCAQRNIEALTLFAFGKENWKRPTKEIRTLFRLFILALRRNLHFLNEHGIKCQIIGDRSRLSAGLIQAMDDVEQKTYDNPGMLLSIAINYSGRWDILQATNRVLQSGHPAPVDESTFASYLCLANIPEPDLLIRTGGAYRLSNFLLWDLAYTEIYITHTLWPDFSEQELIKALQFYQNQERRFGYTSQQLKA